MAVNGEPWLDMYDPEWTAVKVLGQGEKVPMVYSTARDTTISVLNSQHVSCTNITHSGRHSGAKEAVRLKIAEEDIRTGGRWVQGTGKMHQVYLEKQPITFALAMAGFSVKPFHLRRNEVAPSLVLQRLIFPFIEKAIGDPGSRENELWRKECDLEMQEFDPNNSDNLDDVEPYAFEPNPNPLKMNKATALAQRSNKKHVLRLMLRLRRVLLQDAAEYLYRYPDIALSPLLEKSPEVFESQMFDAFKENVMMSLKRHEIDVPTDLPPNVMALQTWDSAQANEVADIKRALADIHVRLDAFEDCFTAQRDQNNWVNDGLDEIQKTLDRPPPVGLQPYFAGIQPFFGHRMPAPIPSPPFQHQQHTQTTYILVCGGHHPPNPAITNFKLFDQLCQLFKRHQHQYIRPGDPGPGR
ncbi:hypothetical protein KI688_007119 [Linnemannia hyalina]|uniref:Ndc10 domain-containing protein n=1 Tax=Linnemannia hyalina TaxID=64524 RepID=A0A9P8BN79_9FUNG|nr:hypothetical protein KI688_007119 [Linnemannia hyalina]